MKTKSIALIACVLSGLAGPAFALEWNVRQLELTEQSGVTRLVVFRTIQLNATIPASAFRFQVPAGAKIYDGE